MIIELLCLLIGAAILALCMVTRPTRATAPRGWYVNGVRPSGLLELRPVLGTPERDLETVLGADHRAIAGRIYCTGGASPRTSGSSVWCQR